MKDKQESDPNPESLTDEEIRKVLARVRAKSQKPKRNSAQGHGERSKDKSWQLHEMAREDRARAKRFRHGPDSENNMYDA